ncbi:MAG: hypothetical protein ACRD09_02265, partial [Vicinamibacterales bacterium]
MASVAIATTEKTGARRRPRIPYLTSCHTPWSGRHAAGDAGRQRAPIDRSAWLQYQRRARHLP